MPRNIFGDTPVSPRAQGGIDKMLSEGSFRGMRGLSKEDKRALAAGRPAVYIYNVSCVWSWERPIIGRGSVKIPKSDHATHLSEPIEVPGIMIRDFDRGNGLREAFTQDGKDLAEDILGCSQEMRGPEHNNLLNFGCFYTIGKRLEELPAAEQERIRDEAMEKHDAMCRMFVLTADQLWPDTRMKPLIVEVHRLAALHVGEERDWVAKRGKASPVMECPWCGAEIKRGVPKCPTCKEVVDQELYAKMQAAIRKAAPKHPQPEA